MRYNSSNTTVFEQNLVQEYIYMPNNCKQQAQKFPYSLYLNYCIAIKTYKEL